MINHKSLLCRWMGARLRLSPAVSIAFLPDKSLLTPRRRARLPRLFGLCILMCLLVKWLELFCIHASCLGFQQNYQWETFFSDDSVFISKKMGCVGGVFLPILEFLCHFIPVFLHYL